MPSMFDPAPPDRQPGSPRLVVSAPNVAENDDRMICERCGKAEMYRMHAVWRCPECGYKTDCCGW
jgi:ribosomal protein L37AE/L43A